MEGRPRSRPRPSVIYARVYKASSMSLLAGRYFETCGELRQLGSFAGAFLLSVAHVLKRDGYDSDSTHYLHSCRRHHNRAITGLWLASLHDRKRGACQVSQAASCLGRHQPLLDIRNSARAFATLTCGSAAFPTSRTHGKAGAFRPHRSAMPIFAMRVE